MPELIRYSQPKNNNCEEQNYRNPDYRIEEFEYNDYTYDLIIKQKPDVVKKVRIKSGVNLGDLAHLNPCIQILNESDTLPKSIIGAFPHIVKPELVNGNIKYYYFTWDNKFNKYRKLLLKNGHEFYNLEDGFKYRVEYNVLKQLDSKVDLEVTYSNSTVEITNSKGKPITIKSATHTDAGLLNTFDKIKLDNVGSYLTNINLTSKAPNVYLVSQSYNPGKGEVNEQTFLLPEVTLAKNGLMTPEHKYILENLIETVTEIKSDGISDDKGLTYIYITRDPSTLETKAHEFRIPLVTDSTHGLMSYEERNKLNDFTIDTENGEIKEIRFRGVLITSERYEVSRDGLRYYITGNDGTEICIESYDEVEGKAGLFNQKIYEKLRTYTNSGKVPVTIGGVQAGTSFNKVPYQELLTRLLYPTIPPAITRITLEPIPGVYERGSNLQLNLIETEVYKKTHDINTIEILDDYGHLVHEFEDNISGGGVFNYNVPTDIDTSKEELYFKVHAVDKTGGSSKLVSDKYTFVYAICYGVIGENDTLDNAIVNGFNKLIETKGDKVIDINANYQKICIGYPKYYGDLKGIYDSSGLNNTPFFDRIEFQRIDSNYQLPYVFYISYIPVSYEGSITIKF